MISKEKIEKLDNSSRILRLKIQNSSVLAKGTIIRITPKGLEGSKRGVHDGIVYFGNKRKRFPKGEVVADFVIPCEKKAQCRDPSFMIYFDVDKNAYFMKDLGIGTGTFIKIEEALTLKDNQLLNMGDSYIVVNTLKKSIDDPCPTLILKLYSGMRIGEISYFYAQECYLKEIYIGRGKDCQLQIDDSLISNCQATIFYSSHKGWTLVDGNLSAQRPSTNGTW